MLATCKNLENNGNQLAEFHSAMSSTYTSGVVSAPFTSDVENLKAAKHSCYFFLSTLFLSKPSTKRKKA